MDQVLADQIGTNTRLPSLELGFTINHFCEGWPCAYGENLSWKAPSTPAPPIRSNKVAFERLFGGFDSQASMADARRRDAMRASVLDVVLDDSKSLKNRLGGADQKKLD